MVGIVFLKAYKKNKFTSGAKLFVLNFNGKIVHSFEFHNFKWGDAIICGCWHQIGTPLNPIQYLCVDPVKCKIG